MAGIDRPGFSLDRNMGLVPSGSKRGMSTPELQGGLNRMQDIYRPLADNLEQVPIVGGIGKMWNRHLDNQIDINNTILGSRRVDVSTPGGVGFDMRRAHTQDGHWGVGAWFGLGYHVETRNVDDIDGKR